jgi:outer membrane protein TolC
VNHWNFVRLFSAEAEGINYMSFGRLTVIQPFFCRELKVLLVSFKASIARKRLGLKRCKAEMNYWQSGLLGSVLSATGQLGVVCPSSCFGRFMRSVDRIATFAKSCRAAQGLNQREYHAEIGRCLTEPTRHGGTMALLYRKMRIANLKRTAALAISLAFAASLPASSQTLTLDEAYNQMVSSEVELQILGIEADIATELVRQARGQRYPRVSLSIKFAEVQQQILSSDNTTFETADSSYPTTTVSLSVVQPIFDQVRWRAMTVAQAEQELTGARAEVARNELANDLVRKYLDVAIAQFGVDRAQTLVRARTQLERALELQIEAGRGDPISLTRAMGDTFSARSDLAASEMDLSDALFGLYRYTGPGFTGVNVGSSGLAAVGANNLEQTFSAERLVEMSPEIQVARAEVIVAEKQREQARAGFRPTANLTLDFTQDQTEGSLFGGGSDIQSTEIGVGVDWLIYEGGVRRSRMREIDSRIELAQLRVGQYEELAMRQFASLTAAISQSNQRAGAIGQQLRLAEQALTDAQAQQEAGRVRVEVTMEQQLRRDMLRIEAQAARVRTLQLQTDVFALFGALDTNTLSGQIGG